mmetsp:Transcript_50841/g.114323  ORF Transcript_50841/g.114323 Transcript_50841/m.114323 type:complete len:381 (+) Transcript_50841:95-1237(+)
MVLLTEDGTSFSWFEYQALMLSLAGVMCLTLGIVELTLSRFQSLPVLFPAMYSVHDRRFYIYEFDITDGRPGKAIRRQSKHVIRMTILVILSYLWQNCVLRADQTIGNEFPVDECDAGSDCFASEVHIATILTRQYQSVDCDGDRSDFEDRQVVSCVRFMEPSASSWLMHLAIANSVAQLNFKCFELGVWLAGKSKMVRHLIVALIVLSSLSVIAMFFLGEVSVFLSSWLAFVMTFSLPLWFAAVHASGYSLKVVVEEAERRMQQSIEANLTNAFQDIESVLEKERDPNVDALELPEVQNPACSKHPDRISNMRSRAKRIIASMRGGINRSSTATGGATSGPVEAPTNAAKEAPGDGGAEDVIIDVDAGREQTWAEVERK